MGQLKIVGNTDYGLQDFLNNQVSEHTKRAYAADLAEFSSFLNANGLTVTHPAQLTIKTFLAYRDEIIAKGIASKTLHRKISALKSLMRWFHLNGHVPTNPLGSLKLSRAEVKTPTQALSDEEVLKVFAACKTQDERLVFELLFKLGLRRSEVLTIAVCDLAEFRGHQIIRIRGKGSKIRELALSAETIKIINDFLKSNPRRGYLIELSDSTLYRLVKRVFKRAGVNENLTPHSCRATVISHLLDTQQTPIRDVADFAGHSNINTTSLYDKKRKGFENSPTYKVNYGKV